MSIPRLRPRCVRLLPDVEYRRRFHKRLRNGYFREHLFFTLPSMHLGLTHPSLCRRLPMLLLSVTDVVGDGSDRCGREALTAAPDTRVTQALSIVSSGGIREVK